jgi:hypothetical protein
MRQPRDHCRGLGRRKGPYNPTTHRLRELEKVISLKFPNGILPYCKSADIYLLHAAKLLRTAEVLDELIIWAEHRAHFTPVEHLNEIVELAKSRQRIEKADELGELLALTDKERTHLKITTIGACDITKAQRARRRKLRKRERDRQRKEIHRREQGALPRREYLKNSLSVLRPWEAEGISRRAWERKRRKQSAK